MESIAAYSCSSCKIVFNRISQFSCLPSLNTPKPSTLFKPSITSLRISTDPFRGGKCRLTTCASIPEGEFELSSSNLKALSPLDGRYSEEVKELTAYGGEYGLNYYRVLVEVKWLLKLSQIPEIDKVPNFSEESQSFLQGLIDGFCEHQAWEIKKIEKVTNHDVKAVEYYLKNKCQSHPEISKVLEFIHFGCTSEDINNLAYGLKLKNSMNNVSFPVMDDLIEAISNMAEDYASNSMVGHTHGQTATPTTLGKEMANFAAVLSKQRQFISQVKLEGKFAGAVGNYNAFIAAYPNINWPRVAKEFVESLGLCFSPFVTQVESHRSIANLFYAIAVFNSSLINFDQDMCGYITLSYFNQISKSGEVGSSTMPHKVNPIDFEKSEGNLGMAANSMLSGIAAKLPISRYQRDLSGSTVMRNIDVTLGYCLVAYKSTLKGMTKLRVNKNRLDEELNKSWEVLAEPIQTVMRSEGVPEAYEKLKELTRGKAVTEKV